MHCSQFLWLIAPAVTFAADLRTSMADAAKESAKRAVVLEQNKVKFETPKFSLPEGFALTTAAAAPLVSHPTMGCVDDRGRLFVGDAVGVNWNKAQLESDPPNRIVMLEDIDGDGVYDKSTVFANKMTFPQGACWHAGSLYVASPPGIWKLTDKDADGVAEVREMIVGGFDYTGNAADVHGPKLHPNGRLYWCHGRKGHRVTQKNGTPVHEGTASGIWSCLPDGSDVQWHALGCADNPTSLEFTPDGDIIGTCNLYYNSPRGDTLMHWLYGGVYERADQMQVIAQLPRTLDAMPVIHNFGHVAVSGCSFWRAQPGSPLYVTHFNTQRLVRMDLTKSGASFQASETEFLKVHDPDVHLTDVLEDCDGSLLVFDTGGWFRIGCPSGLMAKPDVKGTIYRIRPTQRFAKPDVSASGGAKAELSGLNSPHAHARRFALEEIAKAPAAVTLQQADTLREMLSEELDPALEHALLLALQRLSLIKLEQLETETNLTALRRMLVCFVPDDGDGDATGARLGVAARHLDSDDAELARVALAVVASQPDAAARLTPLLRGWLGKPLGGPRLRALEGVLRIFVAEEEMQPLLASMLAKAQPEIRRAALGVISTQALEATPAGWIEPLQAMLEHPQQTGLPLILDAIKHLPSHPFDSALRALVDQQNLSLPLRLKALDAIKETRLNGSTLDLVRHTVEDATASPAARIQAAAMLSTASLNVEAQRQLAPLFAVAGPVELEKLLTLVSKAKDAEVARAYAQALAKNPAIASQQESACRTCFSKHPTEVFETLVLPALHRANEALEDKKRSLPSLAEQAARRGRVDAGKVAFEAGKGSCIACHRVGDLGRPLGPDLSQIGAIRTERDLLESVIFPNATLSRDYETHLIELNDGQSIMGIIKGHTAEGLALMDVAGQQRSVAHTSMASQMQLTTSLMPVGLDQVLTEQELFDLIAWLRSLR